MADEVIDAIAAITRQIELKRAGADLHQEYAMSAEELARIDLITCIREAVEERFGLNGWRLIWLLTDKKRLEKARDLRLAKEKK